MAPIHHAVYRGSLEILQFLLENGADINAISYACLAPSPYVTATNGRSEIERIVRNCTSDTSSQIMQGFTALHLAYFYCRLDIIDLLLHNKADVNIRDANGKTALDVIGGSRKNICDSNTRQKILSIKRIQELRRELFLIVGQDDFQKAKECIEEAESEHIKNEVLNGIDDSINSILLATKEHNLKILRLLINKGGDINLTTSSTSYFSTLLHIAANDDEVEIAQFLLDSDANIDAKNNMGFTPCT